MLKKGAQLTFTMVHNWAENIHVRPRSAIVVEEGGVYLSNYIILKPVKSVQMYPSVRLVGEGAVARLNSVVVAHPGSELDLGGKVVLEAPAHQSRGHCSDGDHGGHRHCPGAPYR